MGNGREHFVFLVLQYIMNFIHLTGMEKLDFDHVKENVQHATIKLRSVFWEVGRVFSVASAWPKSKEPKLKITDILHSTFNRYL